MGTKKTKLEGLIIDHLSIGYGKCLVAKNLSAIAMPGEITCLLGHNGCGKSTLIKSLMGLIPSLNGRMSLNDHDLNHINQKERARKCAVVLTDRQFPDYMRVDELVRMGRYPHHPSWTWHNQEDTALIDEIFALLEIEHLKNRWAQTLSDGEKQRVVLARALAQDPEVLILDEPTAHLDITNKVMTFILLQRWVREKNKILLMSTHDLEMSLSFADQIWLMSKSTEETQCISQNKNSLICGSPEDLLMSQILQSTFCQQGISINANGQLHIQQRTSQPVFVDVDEITFEFVAKALQRRCFSATRDSTCKLQINQSNGRWVLNSAHQSWDFERLLDLCRQLNNICS